MSNKINIEDKLYEKFFELQEIRENKFEQGADIMYDEVMISILRLLEMHNESKHYNKFKTESARIVENIYKERDKELISIKNKYQSGYSISRDIEAYQWINFSDWTIREKLEKLLGNILSKDMRTIKTTESD